MDWLHCNICYTRPQNGIENGFYLSSCGHLYCNQCIVQAQGSTCKVCGKACQTIKLNSSLKPNVAVYFSENAELIQRYIQDTSNEHLIHLTRHILKEYYRIFIFQNGHRVRLLNYYMEKSKYLSEKLDHVTKKLSEEHEENQMLKEHNAYLKHQMEEFNRVHQPGSLLGPGGSASLVGSNPAYGQSTSAAGAATARLCVYTPPINGRIGQIPGSYSSTGSAQGLDQLFRKVHQNAKTAGPPGQNNTRIASVCEAAATPLTMTSSNAATEFVTPVNSIYKRSSSTSRSGSRNSLSSPIVLKRSTNSVLSHFRGYRA